MPMRTFCAEHPVPHFLRKSIQAKGIIQKCSWGMASLNCFMALLEVNLLPRSNKMRQRHATTGVLPKDSKSYHFSSWIRALIFTPTFPNISNNVLRICLNLEILLCLKLFWSVPEPNVLIRDPPWHSILWLYKIYPTDEKYWKTLSARKSWNLFLHAMMIDTLEILLWNLWRYVCFDGTFLLT